MIKTPQAWLKEIWLAKKDTNTTSADGYDENVYTEPIALKINHQPIRGSSDMHIYGEKSDQMQRAFVDKNIFSEFDLVYLDGASPFKRPEWESDITLTKEIKNGFWANYRVKSVQKQNLKTLILFEKLENR